ncbi:MAG: helix-turn-helix domain-containing protein [Nanoarchaeota archaeon]
MDISILEDLGLSKGEIKVYTSLLEIGMTKVGTIIEKSNMASSAVHNSINSLIDKGLIGYIKKGKIKYYHAANPRQLIDFIDDKKKKLLDILPELENKQNLSKEKQEAEIFEGSKGITTMLNILTKDAKKGDKYRFFANNIKENNDEIQKFFVKYDIKRKEMGVKIYGLAPKEIKYLFVKRKFLKMKYPNFPIPTNISIFKNKVVFFSWGEKPVGYLIKSEQITQMYIELFNEIWNLCKN